MSDIFGAKKAAKKQANATLTAANLQADSDAKNAEAVRAAAEQTAAATRAASEQQAQSASLQMEQIRLNGIEAKEAAGRQEALMKSQAAAAEAAAAKMAQDQRDAAQGFQRAKEMDIARDHATEAAAKVLEKAPDNVEVTLASDVQDQAEIDPETGRRRPTRAAFMSNAKSYSGITI